MKAVFLTLILGLVCGAQETPAETESSEITGDWNTIYIAADNKEKIQQGGPLQAYIRHFECINNCEQLSATFYIKAYYNCILLTLVGTREEGDVYVVNYMGENSFEVNRVSENLIILYAENFDGVRKTKVTHALGKGDSLAQEDIQKYEELNSERGIPNENIVDATKTDSCPK